MIHAIQLEDIQDGTCLNLTFFYCILPVAKLTRKNLASKLFRFCQIFGKTTQKTNSKNDGHPFLIKLKPCFALDELDCLDL